MDPSLINVLNTALVQEIYWEQWQILSRWHLYYLDRFGQLELNLGDPLF